MKEVEIIQIWAYTDMPHFIRRCIESLNKYAICSSIKHVIYTDNVEGLRLNGEYDIREIPEEIKDKVSKVSFNYIATKADYLRYLIMGDVDVDYKYYIDSDCFFIKNPFDDIIKYRDIDTFSYDEDISERVINGFFGLSSDSTFIYEMISNVVKIILENNLIIEKCTGIGTRVFNRVFNNSLNKDSSVILSNKWMFILSFEVFCKYLKDYSENRENETTSDEMISVINENIDSVFGIHLSKPHYKESVEEYNEAMNYLLDKIDNIK